MTCCRPSAPHGRAAPVRAAGLPIRQKPNSRTDADGLDPIGQRFLPGFTKNPATALAAAADQGKAHPFFGNEAGEIVDRQNRIAAADPPSAITGLPVAIMIDAACRALTAASR
jgi:hypothetical protein